jgi:hypothetical protein
MNIEFIKSNYFEIFLCIGLTAAGLFRLIFPELRKKEMKYLPINEIHEYAIILYELSAIYFIFYSTEDIRNIYYSIYIIACIIITVYHISNKSYEEIFLEIPELSIFSNDMKTIWYHLIIVFIFIYMIYIK